MRKGEASFQGFEKVVEFLHLATSNHTRDFVSAAVGGPTYQIVAPGAPKTHSPTHPWNYTDAFYILYTGRRRLGKPQLHRRESGVGSNRPLRPSAGGQGGGFSSFFTVYQHQLTNRGLLRTRKNAQKSPVSIFAPGRNPTYSIMQIIIYKSRPGPYWPFGTVIACNYIFCGLRLAPWIFVSWFAGMGVILPTFSMPPAQISSDFHETKTVG